MICPRGCKDENGDDVEVRTDHSRRGKYVVNRTRYCPKCKHTFETVEVPREIFQVVQSSQIALRIALCDRETP